MAEPHKADGENSADLVGQVLVGFGRLVQGELALAQAEAKRGLRDVAKALAIAALAGIFGITALNALSVAAVAALVHLGLSPAWASVTVGLGLLVIGAGLMLYARHLLTPANLAPNRSFQNLRRDAETLKTVVTPNAASNL